MANDPQAQLARWWVTRVLVAAAAVVAVMFALRLVSEALSELSHVIVLVVFGVVIAFALAPLVDRIQRVVRRRGQNVGLIRRLLRRRGLSRLRFVDRIGGRRRG